MEKTLRHSGTYLLHKVRDDHFTNAKSEKGMEET